MLEGLPRVGEQIISWLSPALPEASYRWYDIEENGEDLPDLEAFDIHKENAKTKERYGKEPFGQGCLLARRLVERNVRTVEVSYGGWDTHQNNFTSLPELCHTMDQAVAALLDDLEKIGKLKNIICNKS